VTSIEQELGNEIFKAVEQIVAASHTAATKALDEAFGRKRRATRAGSNTSSRASVGQKAPRRSPEEIQELKDSVYQALCGTPGQLMVELAKEVGRTRSQLDFPIARLKAEGLIRCAGPRRSMRYFPRSSGASEQS
jgi:hypothetical protein